jgi:hypothetical protein
MYQFCITIHGVRHCFEVPLLVDRSLIKKPPPNNYPPFELAATVLELVDVVGPSDFSKELAAVATRFMANVQSGLPTGVELTKSQAAAAAG